MSSMAADIIEQAWRAMKVRQPFDIRGDRFLWVVSLTTRGELLIHKYDGPGSNPISVRGHELRMFDIRVVSGIGLSDKDLLLALGV